MAFELKQVLMHKFGRLCLGLNSSGKKNKIKIQFKASKAYA